MDSPHTKPDRPGMTVALQTRTLSAAIADRLRQDILGGTHASGTQLRQDALAASYGVSRIPVREALFQLEAEGLVDMVPHRGAVVTSLSPDEVRDVLDLRRLLEVRLLGGSIPQLNTADFAEIDGIHAAFGEAITRQDRSRWGALNAALHLAMYRRAPMPRTLAVVQGLLQTSERYTRLQLTTEAAWQRATREHGQLIALCRSRDVAAACALLEAHISAVRADLDAMMIGTGAGSGTGHR